MTNSTSTEEGFGEERRLSSGGGRSGEKQQGSDEHVGRVEGDDEEEYVHIDGSDSTTTAGMVTDTRSRERMSEDDAENSTEERDKGEDLDMNNEEGIDEDGSDNNDNDGIANRHNRERRRACNTPDLLRNNAIKAAAITAKSSNSISTSASASASSASGSPKKARTTSKDARKTD
jgi:hypothetical protein